MQLYIGLDLGGSGIKAGLVDEHGRLLARLSRSYDATVAATRVVDEMAVAAEGVCARAGFSLSQAEAVGIGSPGLLDVQRGVVQRSANIAAWQDVPVCRWLSDRLKLPSVLENDANAAAYGEYWVGAGEGSSVRHMAMLTLGTGIGGGLVIDGEVLHGSTGLAGEIGHTIVQAHGRLCGCGQRGCVEAYASASQTVARAKEALATGEASSLRARWEQAGELTCEDVFEHAKAGDTLAGRIAEETATYLALACINLSRFFEPDLIVLSGGLTRAGDYLFDRIRAEIQQHTWKLMPTPRRVVPARLGTDAGVLGAAGLAFYAREQEQDRLQPAVAEAAVRQC